MTLCALLYSSPHSHLQQPVPTAAMLAFPLKSFCSMLSNVSMQYVMIVTSFWLWLLLQLPLADYFCKCNTETSQPSCGASASHSTINSDSACASAFAFSGQLDSLRAQSADVVAELCGLPPDRGIEHVIPREPDASFQTHVPSFAI